MDVVLLAIDAAAGDGPRVRVLVGREQGVGARDRTGKALGRDLADGHPWREPLEEKGLRHVHGAQSGEVALVEQRRADDGFGIGYEVRDGPFDVPALAEHVGPEVADQRVLVTGRDEVEHAEPGSQRDVRVGRQHRPYRRIAPPSAIVQGPHPPATLHLEVGVEGTTGREPMEDVLAHRDDLDGCVSHQVHRGQGRPAEIRERELVTGQRGVQPPRSLEHRVTFGHDTNCPGRGQAPSSAQSWGYATYAKWLPSGDQLVTLIVPWPPNSEIVAVGVSHSGSSTILSSTGLSAGCPVVPAGNLM